MFNKLGPQKVQHADGYIVQVADRSTVEYLEGNRKAVVEVDFAALTGVYQNSLRGWLGTGIEGEMSLDERVIVLERILAGLKAMGCSVEVC